MSSDLATRSLGEVLEGRREEIVLATKPEQVRSNVAAARWTPSESDLAELESVLNR